MPLIIRKVRNKNCYKVMNKTTGVVHSKCTSLENATAQKKLIYAVDHGWKPNPTFKNK
jgi:hypothetical protein